VKRKPTARKPRQLMHVEVQRAIGVSVSLPIKLVSEANQREHHMVKHRRKKAQQRIASAVLRSTLYEFDKMGVTRVVLTRHGMRKMDADNNAASFKHVQDAVAAWLGVDDGDMQWGYAQTTGSRDGVTVAFIGGKS
jgi:hypothetical protein